MVGLGVVAALLLFLFCCDPLDDGAELRVRPPARAGQVRERIPHFARVHFSKIEMRLLVVQHGSPLLGVVQNGLLDPGLVRSEGGGHAKFEGRAPASPGGIEGIGGLRPFPAL